MPNNCFTLQSHDRKEVVSLASPPCPEQCRRRIAVRVLSFPRKRESRIACPPKSRRRRKYLVSKVDKLINKLTSSPINFLQRARKNNLFLQNEPNYKIAQIYTNACDTRRYKIYVLKSTPKNEPKRTQNEPNFTPILALFHNEIFAFAKKLYLWNPRLNNLVQVCVGKEVRLFVGDGDIQFFYEAVKGPSLDAQDSGGGELSAFSVCECFNNNLSLDLVESRQLVLRISLGLCNNNIKRKRIRLNLAADAQDISPFHSICELTDVSGPGVIYEKLFNLAREHFRGFIIKVSLIFEEKFSKRDDIFFSLPERRNLKSNDVQSIIEVGAEGAFFDHLPQVLCACGNNSNVNRKGGCRAEWSYGLFLKDAKKLRLQLNGYLAYFIEKDCPAVSSSEETKRTVNSAGKSTFRMAEQLALEELACKCCAIDGDKNLVCAVTCNVYLSCYYFLADTCLADYYHRTFSCCNSLNSIKKGLKNRRFAYANIVLIVIGIVLAKPACIATRAPTVTGLARIEVFTKGFSHLFLPKLNRRATIALKKYLEIRPLKL